jgi:multicomponent Na+:H+ antiporter subunit G
MMPLFAGFSFADVAAADLFTIIFTGAGALLFIAGTLGLLRFPDTLSRLHALSKADNLGLGLIVIGLMPQAGSIAASAKMVCVWLLAQLSAATVSQLLAAAAARRKADE